MRKRVSDNYLRQESHSSRYNNAAHISKSAAVVMHNVAHSKSAAASLRFWRPRIVQDRVYDAAAVAVHNAANAARA
jgi:hypothetical protein